MIGIDKLLRLTILSGFGILNLMDNFPAVSASLKWRTPVFLGIIVVLFLVLGLISFLALQKHTDSSALIPPGWKSYDGGKYSFAYPPTWKLKTGFNFKSDVAVYDPMTKKRWAGANGQYVDWPLHYIDIVSVQPTTETASDIVDNYEQSWQVSDSQINRQTLVRNGIEYEVYGVVGVNTVQYQNIAMSNGNTLALLESSLTSLVDTSIENKILTTFQFK